MTTREERDSSLDRSIVGKTITSVRADSYGRIRLMLDNGSSVEFTGEASRWNRWTSVKMKVAR